MMTSRYAIDLGTSITNIYALGGGIVLSEPSVVAVDTDDRKKVKAIGADAKRLIGKTAENTSVVFPVFEGEIADEKLTAVMLRYFLKKIQAKKFGRKMELLFSVPCGADLVMLKKLERLADACSASAVQFVEAPILAALGQNVPLTEFSPCFCMNMGGGCTDIAALSLDGIIAGVSVSLGGGNVDAELIEFVADRFGLKIGLLTAERIKEQIGSLLDGDNTGTVVNGRDIATGKPRSIALTAEHVKEPIEAYYAKVLDIAEMVMAKLPAEVSAEIRHAGIYVSGGSAQVPGLQEYCENRLGIAVNVAEDPTSAVVLGAGMLLGNQDLKKRLAVRK